MEATSPLTPETPTAQPARRLNTVRMIVRTVVRGPVYSLGLVMVTAILMRLNGGTAAATALILVSLLVLVSIGASLTVVGLRNASPFSTGRANVAAGIAIGLSVATLITVLLVVVIGVATGA